MIFVRSRKDVNELGFELIFINGKLYEDKFFLTIHKSKFENDSTELSIDF